MTTAINKSRARCSDGYCAKGAGRTCSVEVFRLLREAAAQQHQTVVYVTHDQGLAAQADRVLRMQDGRIEEA